MRFDWVYVNAFWAPGASGSIYAVRDPVRAASLVRAGAGGSAAELTAGFIRAARAMA